MNDGWHGLVGPKDLFPCCISKTHNPRSSQGEKTLCTFSLAHRSRQSGHGLHFCSKLRTVLGKSKNCRFKKSKNKNRKHGKYSAGQDASAGIGTEIALQIRERDKRWLQSLKEGGDGDVFDSVKPG